MTKEYDEPIEAGAHHAMAILDGASGRAREVQGANGATGLRHRPASLHRRRVSRYHRIAG
jgi:hypothetical protein